MKFNAVIDQILNMVLYFYQLSPAFSGVPVDMCTPLPFHVLLIDQKNWVKLTTDPYCWVSGVGDFQFQNLLCRMLRHMQ